MRAELLPCPFCGGMDFFVEAVGITCRTCHAQVLGAAGKSAADTWNTRDPQPFRAGQEDMRRRAEVRGLAWTKPDALKLAAGEMTAQELRTAVAVAKGIASAIAALRTLDKAEE